MANDLTLVDRLRTEDGIEVRTAGDESLVHNPATGKIHVLNGTAAHILQRCDGATTLAAIVDDLAAATGASHDRIVADVVALCYDFREKGLVV